MKNRSAILILPAIAVFGFLLLCSYLHHSRVNIPPQTKATPVSFTDSNGNQFTVYIAGAIVNGTNIVVSNLNVNVRPIPPGNALRQQTNQTSK